MRALKQSNPNPFNEDHFFGNDDHIDALKDALGEALAALRTMRDAYGKLHDGLNDMIGEGEGEARLTAAMIPDDYRWLADQLTTCVSADREAADILAQYPEDNA